VRKYNLDEWNFSLSDDFEMLPTTTCSFHIWFPVKTLYTFAIDQGVDHGHEH